MRRHAVAAVMLGLAPLLLTGCGAGKDGGVASLNGSSTQTTTQKPAASTDPQEAALEFAKCMRANGVKDFPDPKVGDDGGIMVQGRGNPGNMDAERRAMDKCRDKLPKGGGNFSDEDRQKMQDQMLKFARCMREHGINMPDPKFDGTGGAFRMQSEKRGTRGGFQGSGPGDPKFDAAQKACQQYFGGPGGGPRAVTQGSAG